MSALEPGLYRATVRGVKDVTVMVDGSTQIHTLTLVRDVWGNDYSTHHEHQVTNARPLIVLNLEGYSAPSFVTRLRAAGFDTIPDQIEAQTKPARIPEPGLWGVVEAKVAAVYGPCNWVKDEYGWVSHSGVTVKWDLLIDPILIRAGVDS